jgi:dimethylhistidine N-methyltransferase
VNLAVDGSPQHRARQRDTFMQAVVDGLSLPQKCLPSRFFYDARGSRLFETITTLPEYYPTRVETRLLATHASSITEALPADGVLVEFGSGSSRKTELLLKELAPDATYAAIDVSPTALHAARERLAKAFPSLAVRLIVDDFCTLDRLPDTLRNRPKLGFFPGSTIGNFMPRDAKRLLRHLRSLLAPGGRLVVGVDLKKDAAILEAAYNDTAGVTAQFNLNMLSRINREIAPIFDLEAFEHLACYNLHEGRIEMHLVCRRPHTIVIDGHRISFKPGETIHTENSYKYESLEFAALAKSAGWTHSNLWVDPDALFSIHELR